MVKNSGGKKFKKLKHNIEVSRPLELPDEEQEFALVNKLLGNGRATVTFIKNNTQTIDALGIISGKLRKRKQWVIAGNIVLISIRDYEKEKVDIYFARSNILHKEKKYQKSSENLQIANKLKLAINPSDCNLVIKRSNFLLMESEKRGEVNNKKSSYPQSIFIVGMPRSGSTLVESIISLNNKVKDLGEINILEKAFTKSRNLNQKISLTDLYIEEINQITKGFSITSNKWLYNYQYAGIIAKEILNSKIIHCFRNPLDNILSIHRANFDTGNYYSSSLIDSTKVYLDQEKIISIYKDQFPQKIYDLNYDLLVTNPGKEIKSLINWLGWEWNESYVSPHLNKRAIYTASDIQVRSPINSKSIRGWKNYKQILEPSIKMLTQTAKYRDLL